MHESEWQTRKTSIDKQLWALNPAWDIIPYTAGLNTSIPNVMINGHIVQKEKPSVFSLYFHHIFMVFKAVVYVEAMQVF